VRTWMPAIQAGMTENCFFMFCGRTQDHGTLRGHSWTRFLAWLSFSVLLSACASVRGPGDLNAGRHALMNGNYQAAVSDFEAAEQLSPNYIYGGELREGVLSYLGQAQYLTGNYAQARQTLQKALSQHKSDSVGRLYLGLTLHHFGEQKAALQNIKAGIEGIFNFLKTVNSSFALDYGQGWDPGGIIVTRIETALAIIDSGNIDWPKLISDGEFIAIAIEVEDNRFLQEETRFPGFQ
jgi:tetratricopeptide (TPR) repeat protein